MLRALTCRLIPVALCLIALPGADAPQTGPRASLIGRYVWSDSDPGFGGFSGIELSDDGGAFTTISDRGQIWGGLVDRDAAGVITGMAVTSRHHLRDSKGAVLPVGRLADAEGLALAPDGTIWISYENLTRVVAHDAPDAPAQLFDRPQFFKDLPGNSALEALAIAPDGTLIALAEHVADAALGLPVWARKDGNWHEIARLPHEPGWLAVGADYGPDGQFYLLERNFKGILGFASRVRRFAPDFTGGQILLETSPRTHDNLEGLSVWRDSAGAIRLTMISDDNFRFFQTTEIVEYRLTEAD